MSQAQESGGLSRRRFLQGVGAAGATGALLAAGSSPAAAWGLSWEDAAVAGGAAAGGPVGAYLTHEVVDATGGETVEPGSSTPEAIAESWWRTAMYAKEHDEQTLQVFWNRLEDARTIANVRAKGVAIQAIQNGESESFVLEGAKDEIDQYYAMIQENLANHWQAQVNKVFTAAEEYQQHDAISSPELFIHIPINTTDARVPQAYPTDVAAQEDLSLLDGSSVTVPYFDLTGTYEVSTGSFEVDGDLSLTGDPPLSTTQHLNGETYSESINRINVSWRIPSTNLDGVDTSHNTNQFSFSASADPTDYSEASTAIDEGESWDDWNDLAHYWVLWDGIVQQHSQMIDNIEAWVSNAYGSVQSGEIDVQDLVNNNPTVMASEWSTRYEQTGHLAYAAADLAALGLSFDSDRRMSFELDDGTTLDGTLYVSDDEFEINVGEIVEPSASSANFYAAADTATMERFLPDGEFRESVDGGEVKLNVGVVKQTEYVVQTTNDETVTIAWDDWSIPEGSDAAVIEDAESVVYDASGDLDTAVTSVESVLHRYASSESATVLELTDPFKITEAYDVETGEEADVVSGQGYNAGTTDVDLSWVDDYMEMRENTDDYANSGGGGGGGGGVNWNGFDFSYLNDMLPDFLPDQIMGIPTWAVLLTGGGILLVAR